MGKHGSVQHCQISSICSGPLSGNLLLEKALQKFQIESMLLTLCTWQLALAKGQFASRALPTLGYIAQVVPPFTNVGRIGTNAVMQCLHMCGNSLSNKTAFSLDCLGGPKFPDLTTHLVSANIRAPFKTLKGHEKQHHHYCHWQRRNY